MKEKRTRINNGINYRGEVSISVMDGKRKLQSFTHNNGRKGLFNFLTNCLLGNFTAAKSSYPSKIACFGTPAGNSETARLSSFVRYDTSRWDVKDDSEAGSSVYFHFRIPYAALKAGVISTLRLYVNEISGDEVPENICAEITLNEPDYITVPDTVDGNFTIIVDWKMTLTDIEPNKEN